MTGSLCYTAEIDRTLQINYNRKNKNLLKILKKEKKSSSWTHVGAEHLAMRLQVTMGPEGPVVTSLIFGTWKHSIACTAAFHYNVYMEGQACIVLERQGNNTYRQ